MSLTKLASLPFTGDDDCVSIETIEPFENNNIHSIFNDKNDNIDASGQSDASLLNLRCFAHHQSSRLLKDSAKKYDKETTCCGHKCYKYLPPLHSSIDIACRKDGTLPWSFEATAPSSSYPSRQILPSSSFMPNQETSPEPGVQGKSYSLALESNDRNNKAKGVDVSSDTASCSGTSGASKNGHENHGNHHRPSSKFHDACDELISSVLREMRDSRSGKRRKSKNTPVLTGTSRVGRQESNEWKDPLEEALFGSSTSLFDGSNTRLVPPTAPNDDILVHPDSSAYNDRKTRESATRVENEKIFVLPPTTFSPSLSRSMVTVAREAQEVENPSLSALPAGSSWNAHVVDGTSKPVRRQIRTAPAEQREFSNNAKHCIDSAVFGAQLSERKKAKQKDRETVMQQQPSKQGSGSVDHNDTNNNTSTKNEEEIIYILSKEDYVTGRGGHVSRQPCNQRVRELIQRLSPSYFETGSRALKNLLVHQVIESIYTNGGRVLKRDSSTNGWIECSFEESRMKVSQRFREEGNGRRKRSVAQSDLRL